MAVTTTATVAGIIVIGINPVAPEMVRDGLADGDNYKLQGGE